MSSAASETLPRHPECTPHSHRGSHSSLQIIITPTKSGRKWVARLGVRVLCVAAAPFVKSARLLLAEGYPAETLIEMWRPNTAEWALRGRLGAVAATVIDGEKASRDAENGVPVRSPVMAAHTARRRTQ